MQLCTILESANCGLCPSVFKLCQESLSFNHGFIQLGTNRIGDWRYNTRGL